MTKLKKPLLSWGAKGSLDGTTFQARHRSTVAREKPFPRNPKSAAQLAQRQKYHDAVDAWNALSPEEKEEWRGVCPGLTAYQCFMRAELKKAPPPPPPPQEKTEEQTQYNTYSDQKQDSGWYVGQRLTIPNRKVTKLSFVLRKYRNPRGNITFQIRRWSPDELICEKVLFDASQLTTTATWYEVEFDTPQTINDDCVICSYYPHGGLLDRVRISYQNTNVKPDEYLVERLSGPWTERPTYDLAYRYKYYEA